MRFLYIPFVFIFLFSCSSKKSIEFNAALSARIDSMAAVDQEVQKLFLEADPDQYRYKDSLQLEKEIIFRENSQVAREILMEYGFPGYDLVGEISSKNFWLIVQHCDHNRILQQMALDSMIVEVLADNADSKNYAYLVDRVKINTGQPQIYGTQLRYNTVEGIALPKLLYDSVNVDERRKQMGLPPLQEYLDHVTEQWRKWNNWGSR